MDFQGTNALNIGKNPTPRSKSDRKGALPIIAWLEYVAANGDDGLLIASDYRTRLQNHSLLPDLLIPSGV
jgi:hypothetical protein